MTPCDEAPGSEETLQARLQATELELQVARARLKEAESLASQLAQARAEAERQRARLELVSSVVSDALLVVDNQHRVLLSNDRALELTGFSSHDFMEGYAHLYTASDRHGRPLPFDETPILLALQGIPSRERELTLHLRDRDVTIQATATPLVDEKNFVSEVAVAFLDVTRRTRAERRTELLNEVSALLSSGELGPVQFAEFARLLGEVMGAWTVIGLISERRDALELVAAWHPDANLRAELDAARSEIPIVLGVDKGMARVAITGKSILNKESPPVGRIPDLDPRIRDIFGRMGSESLIIVPLRARGSNLGSIMLLSLPHEPRFAEEDLEYSLQLADRVSATLDNVRLLQDVRARERRNRLLADLSRQFSATLEVQQVLLTVVAQVTEALGDWCTIGLADPVGELIRPQAVYHRNPQHNAALRRLADTYLGEIAAGIPARVTASLTPVLVSQPMAPEGFKARLEESPWLKTSTYLCVPLLLGAKCLGYLDLACSQEGGRILTLSELELVQELAHRAASAIENARLYEELHQVLRAKDDWLSVASHELKTPLTPLQVLLQLMVRKIKRGDPIQVEQLERCLGQVSKLTKLINTLLDVSRLEQGHLELVLESFDLRGLAEEVLASFRDASERHRLVLVADEEPLVIDGDRSRLEQVLVNLVYNAIKYSPEGGEVKVTLRRTDRMGPPQAVITVDDEGIGIPEQERTRLFQRFFRASNVSERNFGGLGLGLWISHEIVVRHNGMLWAERRPEKGSRFVCSLPLIREDWLDEQTERPKIMIVDDDPAILETAEECLRDEGFLVTLARNGHAAMAALEEQRPTVVLLDLMMPRMDGWGFVKRVHGMADGHRVKVIVMSATHDLGTRAQELGVFDHLAKPFNLDEMMRKVKHAVATARAGG